MADQLSDKLTVRSADGAEYPLSDKTQAGLKDYARRHGVDLQTALDQLLDAFFERNHQELENERKREELLAAFDEAETDLEAARYSEHTEDTSSQLADALKGEARTERR